MKTIIGKIKAIQLDYTEAYKCLVQAIRKCPQNTALGFRKIATKFAIIVQLLMGEIPEKSLFRQKGLSQSLTPYYKLTLAVRVGDLAKFKTEVQKYEEHFHRDKTYSLIQRFPSPFSLPFLFSSLYFISLIKRLLFYYLFYIIILSSDINKKYQKD